MKIRYRLISAIAVFVLPMISYAQCATGVDTGGGSCVPPEAVGMGNSNQPQATGPLWQDKWGAIVVDDSTGSTGTSKEMNTREDAIAAATKDCRSDGSTKCKVNNAYRNTCVVIVSGDGGDSIATNNDIARAEADAGSKCSSVARDCRPVYRACSLPVRVR
ncbi:DUF4189 domain-containing protein [Bacillus sp. NP157]|nr:DUF4189 domain-containing protein [Bacillus sp. NP157]